MLATKDWIYLDLEKTGCTFLRQVLIEIYGANEFTCSEQHKPQTFKSSLPKILTIRQPTEYYFSLWSYGLDKQGGFYKKISTHYPDYGKKMFKDRSNESFSWFLDFALNTSTRYSNPLSTGWLPRSCDLYTARILSQLIPINCRSTFIDSLNACNSWQDSIADSLGDYMPEVVLRTKSLNKDFHTLANAGKLAFMDLPENWKNLFPIDAPAVNQSTLSSKNNNNDKIIKSYYSKYWLSVLTQKSAVFEAIQNQTLDLLSNKNNHFFRNFIKR